MTRHGLPTIHPATRTPRETMALILNAALAATGQQKPASACRRNGNMTPITEPQATRLSGQTRRHPPAKLRPNPKSP